MNIYDTLTARGLVAQTTGEDDVRRLLGSKNCVFYTGYDPTADSLHAGHLLQLMMMRRLQLAGHTPIVLLGTGTTMVGDPTGKTELRNMMTREQISSNAERFKKQMQSFIDFSPGKALLLSNGDWLMKLGYIDFLRDIGVHFSVNKMLSAECFKSRLERGLSFIEFNYMLMQSYDFLHLYSNHNCMLQLGGNDQWANIIGGVELVRRATGKQVFGLTFNLLTTRDGKKMGKTEKGAVWLDPEKTTPYEFYQYWRNVDDTEVITCLKMLTETDLKDINDIDMTHAASINTAKATLAFELTRTVHGKDAADNAKNAATTLFEGADGGNVPECCLPFKEYANGAGIITILVSCKLAPTTSEARRLVAQGGISVDGRSITAHSEIITCDMLTKGVLIKRGKKQFCRVFVSH